MSDLDTSISTLERELALKKGYKSLTIGLPKNLPADVAEEIRTKIREAADRLAGGNSVNYGELEVRLLASLTEEEITVLKQVAQTVLTRADNPPPATVVLNGGVTIAPLAPGEKPKASPGGASVHVPKPGGSPRKARIITAENVRGEGKKYAAPEDEIYVANPEKVDDHGMVSATHLKRGTMLKIPLDDIDLLD